MSERHEQERTIAPLASPTRKMAASMAGNDVVRDRRPDRSSVLQLAASRATSICRTRARRSSPPTTYHSSTTSRWSCRPAAGCASSAKSTTSTARRARFVLPALGMIPVDRDNPAATLGALEQAADVLRSDELFAIYPEGTRSRDGSLQAGHTGVGLLSVDTGVPIVPTGIIGTNRIQPPGARFPRPFRPAVIRFGAPIDPACYRGTRRECRRRITSDVMRVIGELTGQSPDAKLDGLDGLPPRTQRHHDTDATAPASKSDNGSATFAHQPR